ncbi:MAG: metal-binding protein [Pyrinomonadaceae bacterium]|nr:metal-binding protein [Pyrinomonadaceae bacterium]
MPSGKTHDIITLMLAAPAFAAGYAAFGELPAAAAGTAAFVFGGLMFGPDLDTASKQYSRWGIFKFLWMPYSVFFTHRSRWSHGLVFGTLIRVVYFMGVLTLASFAGSYLAAAYSGGDLPRFAELLDAWGSIGAWARSSLGSHILIAAFAGMWLGAASHTFTDTAGTYIKTGRITEFL